MPKKTMSVKEKRTTVLYLRLTPTEAEEIHKRLDREKLGSAADVARWLIVEWAGNRLSVR